MEELLDPRQTAVIVIDVENGFASDESTLARAGLDVSQGRAAIPRMNELLRAARASGVHIVYMQSVYSQEMNLPNNYAFWGPWETMPIHDFSWETEFHPDLDQPRAEDMIVKKYNYDAFSDTPLNLHLRARGIKTLAFIGIETCTCVETSARHAFILGYNVVIVSDCCASCGATVQESRELHDAALRILGARFGKILTSSEVARAWSGALATAAP
jgi:ureidoacrylate peracid hydrolase